MYRPPPNSPLFPSPPLSRPRPRHGFPQTRVPPTLPRMVRTPLQPGAHRMSHDPAANHATEATATDDATEAVVPYIPVILPLAGAVMMFLLADRKSTRLNSSHLVISYAV